MTVEQTIKAKLTEKLSPILLEVINESANHHVPPNSESHFKVIIVAEQFRQQSRVNQHRMVNVVLAEELATKIHALALHTYTPEEWEAVVAPPKSPLCKGGKQKDNR